MYHKTFPSVSHHALLHFCLLVNPCEVYAFVDSDHSVVQWFWRECLSLMPLSIVSSVWHNAWLWFASPGACTMSDSRQVGENGEGGVQRVYRLFDFTIAILPSWHCVTLPIHPCLDAPACSDWLSSNCMRTNLTMRSLPGVHAEFWEHGVSQAAVEMEPKGI